MTCFPALCHCSKVGINGATLFSTFFLRAGAGSVTSNFSPPRLQPTLRNRHTGICRGFPSGERKLILNPWSVHRSTFDAPTVLLRYYYSTPSASNRKIMDFEYFLLGFSIEPNLSNYGGSIGTCPLPNFNLVSIDVQLFFVASTSSATSNTARPVLLVIRHVQSY